MEKGKIKLTQEQAENTLAGGVVVGKRDGQTMIYDDASLGGYFVGKLHSEGGIQMINKSTGQPLEVQGSEVIITAPAVNDQTKHNFNGKMMTNREILSKINSDGGGVSFADGGDIPAKIHTTEKEYEYGGKMVQDSEIANHLGMNSTLKKGKQHFTSGNKTYDVDAIYNAIKKGKLRLKTKEVETFAMKYPVYDKKYSETVKTDFRKPNGLTVRTESGEEVLIDGNHRMNNAYLKGRKTMKTYYIEDPKQIAKFTKNSNFELGGENKDFDDLVKTKFSEGYGKIKHFELTNFGGSWKYINNQNVTSSQRDKMPVYVIETSNDIKEKARQISKNYKSSRPKEISILDFAEKFTKDNNGKIYHKSKSGSVYVKIYQNGHPKEIRISDHYILDRDSLNPKVRYDLEIVQKNFDETTPSNLDYWTDEFKNGGHLSKNKSLKQISEMHNVSLAHVNEELAKGLEVEKEHFADFKERTRVAKDHLVENPKYYSILEKAGLKRGGKIEKEDLVKDAERGNTPARDLNNYNDIMDLEADGMVGMESGLAFAKGGNVNSQRDKVYDLKLDYKIGQKFEQDKLGGKYLCKILAMDFTVNENGEVNHNSYYIEYLDGNSNSEQRTHFKFLKHLKKEPNNARINVPYSIGSDIYYESSEYSDKPLSLLKSTVNGFQVLYYGQRTGWFNYYLDSKETVDSKDAYSSVENYVNKVLSEITSTKLSSFKKLNQFVEPASEKIKVTVDYFIGQKFKLPVMGGFEDAEIVEIDLRFDKEKIYPNSERSILKYKESNGRIEEQELQYFIKEIGQQKPNEIEVIVKAKVKDDVLILHRYMGGSKLQITQVQGYVLRLNNSGVNLDYCVSDDCYDEQSVYISLENFKESITRSNKKKVEDVDDLSELLEMVKSGNYANGGQLENEPKEGDLITNFGNYGVSIFDVDTNYVYWLDQYASKQFCKKSDLSLNNLDDDGDDDGYYEDERNSWVCNKSYAYANGGLTPYDANQEGDSVSILSTGGGVGLPKVAYVKVTNTGASLTNLLGNKYNSYIEFAESVKEAYKPFMNVKPIRRSYVELEAYDQEDKKLVSATTYIADQKNTVKNFNPTTGNYKNLQKSLENSRPVYFKKYDWEDWFLSKGITPIINSQKQTNSNALKELDLKDTKVWIGDDTKLSEEIQKAVFSLGWGWGYKGADKVVKNNIQVQAFYFDEYNVITYSSGISGRSFYELNKGKELNPQDILLAKKPTITTSSNQQFDLSLTKIVLYDSEASEKVQKRAFELGWSWNGLKEVKNTDERYMYFDKEKNISSGSNFDVFRRNQFKEIFEHNLFGTQPKYPEYYKFVDDTNSDSFTKGKIYKIRNPKDIEAEQNFIDNNGILNGFSGSNSKYFKPSTEQAYLVRQKGVSSISSTEPKIVDAVNVEFIYPNGRIEVSATINISNLKNALANFWNMVDKKSWEVRITPFENQFTPFKKNKLIIGSDFAEYNPETFSEGQLGNKLKTIYPDLDWSIFLKEKAYALNKMIVVKDVSLMPNVNGGVTEDYFNVYDLYSAMVNEQNSGTQEVFITVNDGSSLNTLQVFSEKVNIEKGSKPYGKLLGSINNDDFKNFLTKNWFPNKNLDWSEFFGETKMPISNSVVPKSIADKKLTDFKEIANQLEVFALKASEKYYSEAYEDSLSLLKEVKQQYSFALSFTPESSFMYERIELMKKIAEIQKEITRISELKNGGAYYILSKVIEKLHTGENWKQSVGEILTNEVPQQEIDAVIHTEKFKNWFGDWETAIVTKENDYVSKAVNENGMPSVMYHGAKRIKYSYRQVSNGVLYLAENRSYAEWFSAVESPFQKQGDYLTQCFVNLKNPIDLTPLGVDELDLRDIIRFIDTFYPLAKIYDVLQPNTAMQIMNNNLIGGQLFRAWNIIRQYPKLNEHIRDNTGYDGFIYYENNPSDMIINQSTGNMEQNITKATAVFNSNQVKLVDAILFDGSLDDWRFETGGKVNY